MKRLLLRMSSILRLRVITTLAFIGGLVPFSALPLPYERGVIVSLFVVIFLLAWPSFLYSRKQRRVVLGGDERGSEVRTVSEKRYFNELQ